jgi:hypothetical protein
MFGSSFREKPPARRETVERVQAWTRARFALGGDVAISVAQVECRIPGCPPLETVVSFWDADGKRYHFKIFKRLEELREADLPFTWMKEALQVAEGWECSCC